MHEFFWISCKGCYVFISSIDAWFETFSLLLFSPPSTCFSKNDFSVDFGKIGSEFKQQRGAGGTVLFQNSRMYLFKNW
jgi:hypothetical protein